MKLKKTTKFSVIPLLFAIILFSGCMKDFLNLKRNKSQVTPESLSDFRALADDNGYMNYNFPTQLATIGADEFYVSESQWLALTIPVAKNGYIWNDEIYEGTSGDDWNRGFEKVMFANFIIEGVKKIEENLSNQTLRNSLIGEGHFYRGLSFFLMAQLFCEQYENTSASLALGLPLRTTSNINVNFSRSNLADTYSLILADIAEAIRLLPLTTEANTRPSKAAAFTLGAMVYLQMGDFSESLRLAQEAYALKNVLIDYNSINVDATNPFSQYGRENQEILFYAQVVPSPILSNSRLTIGDDLFNSYSESDLRKRAFFRQNAGRLIYKGGYTGGSTFMFSGITTSELHLIIAECKARLDASSENAVHYLNRLRSNRIRTADFQEIPPNISNDECLNLILDERKKELIFQGSRWRDLRRYSAEGRLTSPLTRDLNGSVHTLPLESKKWVWPIPPDVISISGLTQNPR